MATNYPGALDGTTPATHGDVWDAVRAVQAELGTDPSGASATVKARFDSLAGGGGATNLTVSRDTTSVTVLSDTGTDATLPAVDTNAGVMTAAMKTKFDGIATSATANSSDATLLARANHTGTQTADTITDGTTNKAYTATEKTKLSGVATSATANSADATLLARANHTGTQTADTITDGTTNKAYTATEKTKLAGIATGATALTIGTSGSTAMAGNKTAGDIGGVTGTGITAIVALTQAAYDLLTPVSTTLYVITP